MRAAGMTSLSCHKSPQALAKIVGSYFLRRTGDIARQLLMYSLVFTIPGTPVLWYGEEIGMGEDLRLEERNSVRTPMQWTAEHNSGFSTAPRKKLRRPVLERG